MNKILIIDDEEEICALLSGMLRKQGFDVATELTVKGGLNTFKEDNFDLVFLDLNLPDGNGFDLIPKLKEEKPDIEIYIISAYDGQAEQDKAMSSGASGFISKPFTRGMINEALSSVNKIN